MLPSSQKTARMSRRKMKQFVQQAVVGRGAPVCHLGGGKRGFQSCDGLLLAQTPSPPAVERSQLAIAKVGSVSRTFDLLL